MNSTKELAWELGVLRKRSSSTSALKRLQKIAQEFSHLIIIDFESTCWENEKYRPQEIIEFPAVLLDTVTGECLEEFHHYILPVENPVLSDFCRNLTGITQQQTLESHSTSACLASPLGCGASQRNTDLTTTKLKKRPISAQRLSRGLTGTLTFVFCMNVGENS